VFHKLASVVQKASEHAIPIAPVFAGQFDDFVSYTLFIGLALGHLSLRRSELAQCAASTTLIHAKFLPHMIDAFTMTRSA